MLKDIIEAQKVEARKMFPSLQVYELDGIVEQTAQIVAREVAASLTQAHKVEMERLVKEIILKAEIHMGDGAWVYLGDIKTIANKFNIEVK